MKTPNKGNQLPSVEVIDTSKKAFATRIGKKILLSALFRVIMREVACCIMACHNAEENISRPLVTIR